MIKLVVKCNSFGQEKCCLSVLYGLQLLCTILVMDHIG